MAASLLAAPLLAESLEEQLSAYRTASAARVPAEAKATMKSATEGLRADGLPAKALQVGDPSPMFTLPDARGGDFSLAQALDVGPVVLVFYRSGWCPYCNIQLNAMGERLDEFQAQGATVVAIAPEPPAATLTTAEKSALQFPVLSDEDNQIARQFGVVFTLSKELAELYGNFGIQLVAKKNQPGTYQLPLAATYIIAPDGKITYAFLDADYTRRAEPQELLDFLAKK